MNDVSRRVHVLPDAPALAQAVADHVVDVARFTLAHKKRFDIALAGGSTPRAANALLAALPLRDLVDWALVRFFFSDERCVPPTDDESNFKMADETLLEPLEIAETQVFRMRGEDEPAAAARAYAGVLRRELGDPPVFDLVMLGMGPDGHTASLFPGTDPLTDDDALVRAPYVEKFSTHRLTLTPRVINAARYVSIAAGGAEKADALREVFEGPRDPLKHPVEIVAPAGGKLDWFVDAAAAAKLQTTEARPAT